MSLLPTRPINNETDVKIKDGDFYKLPKFCGFGYRKRCQNFYNSSLKNGANTCPYGFTCYVITNGDQEIVHSGLRVEGFYNKKLTSKKIKGDTSPILTVESLKSILNAEQKIEIGPSEQALMLVHDIRTFVRNIKDASKETLAYSKQLIKILKGHNLLYGAKNNLSDNVQKTKDLADLISTKIDFYEYLMNPGSVDNGRPRDKNIHKILEKNVHCLYSYSKAKEVEISFNRKNGDSFRLYDSFDLVPFILLDNALKYSPRGGKILIDYILEENYLFVSISSVGPYIELSERALIFEKGYRGKNSSYKTGTGLGLYIAELILSANEVEILVESDLSKSSYPDQAYNRFLLKIPFNLKN